MKKQADSPSSFALSALQVVRKSQPKVSIASMRGAFLRMASKMLNESPMRLRLKSKKILIPDVPPRSAHTTKQGLVIAGIGALCASVVVAAALFVFFGA